MSLAMEAMGVSTLGSWHTAPHRAWFVNQAGPGVEMQGMLRRVVDGRQASKES